MDLGELLENLEPIVVEFLESGTISEEIFSLIFMGGGLGVIVVYTFIITVLPYFIASLANAFIFSLAPAFRNLIKKMKESNEHGDSTSEFRHLNGSKMKMLYQSETIFYLKYMDECSELGIGPWAEQKQQTLQQQQARQMVQAQQRPQSQQTARAQQRPQSQPMPQNRT